MLGFKERFKWEEKYGLCMKDSLLSKYKFHLIKKRLGKEFDENLRKILEASDINRPMFSFLKVN
jgi:hypothetical protein